MSTYLPGIPKGTDLISNSQLQIQSNFGIIDNGIATDPTGSIGFNRDHVTMTDGTNGGLHKHVIFPGPPTLPFSPPLSTTQSAVYPNLVSYMNPTDSFQELFYNNATKSVQITNSQLIPSLITGGAGMLPGGLQIRAGSPGWPGQNMSIYFTPRFPTACLSVVVTNTNSGNNNTIINVSTFDNISFTVFSTNKPSGSNLSYIAIGY